jgi:hypothetical protein
MTTSPDHLGTAEQITSQFKGAAQLVAKQALRTRLATIDLPKEYTALGKYVYGVKDLETKHSDHYRTIDSLRRKLGDLEASKSSGSTGAGVAAKAQGFLKNAGDLAQRKLVENQLASALARLGEAASANPVPGGEPFLKAVDEVKAKIAALDSEIAALSQMSADGGWLTPKRIVLGAGILAAVLVAAFVFRPSGNRRTDDPYADDKRELAALGDEQLEKLRQADALWKEGDFDAAAGIYAQVVEKETRTFGGTKARDSLPQPMGRLIDHVAGKGGMAAATGYAVKSLNIRVTPLVMTDDGSSALEAARREKSAEQDRRERENASQRSSRDSEDVTATRQTDAPAVEASGELPTGLTGIFGERVGPDFSPEELRAVAGRFIQNEVRPGWELERVLGLLGKPSTFSRTNGLVGQSPDEQRRFMDDPLIPPGVKRSMSKELVICTWNDSTDPDNRFIKLAFVNGRLSGDEGAIVVQLAK